MMKTNDFSDLKKILTIKENRPSSVVAKKSIEKKSVVKRTVQGKEQKPSHPYGPGARIVFMDSDVRGTILSSRKGRVTIETDDGFTMEADMKEIVPTDRQEEKVLKQVCVERQYDDLFNSKNRSARNCLTVDLHIDALPEGPSIPEDQRLQYQMEIFRRVLRENLKHRGCQITFIHGVGDGILKNAILKELDEVYALRCTYNAFHSGATTVKVR